MGRAKAGFPSATGSGPSNLAFDDFNPVVRAKLDG